MTDVPNIPQRGVRLGKWLTKEQARQLLAVPDLATLKGKRDTDSGASYRLCATPKRAGRAGCRDHQLREGRWLLADLEAKGKRVRTVAVPIWITQAINSWMAAGGIEEGRLLRIVRKGGKTIGNKLSDWAVWSVVEQAAKQIGIEQFGAHYLRRTCTKLCSKAGGDLEQIKFMSAGAKLGHSAPRERRSAAE